MLWLKETAIIYINHEGEKPNAILRKEDRAFLFMKLQLSQNSLLLACVCY